MFDAGKFELNAIKKEGKSFGLIDAGTYIGKCVQVIDLGTTEKEWDKGTYESRSVSLGFAFKAGQTKKDDSGVEEVIEEQEVLIRKTYSLSMSTQSALYKDVISWLGKLTEAESKEFNVFTLIWKEVMISISHKAAKKDKTKIYANIASLASPVKWTPAYENEIELDGSIMAEDQFNEKLFESLPPFLKDEAVTSREYLAMHGEQSLADQDKEIEAEIAKSKEAQKVESDVSTEDVEDLFNKKDDSEMK